MVGVFVARRMKWDIDSDFSLDGFPLVRVLRGETSRLSSVSPDGCRLLIYKALVGTKEREINGGYRHFSRVASLELINFCANGQL